MKTMPSWDAFNGKFPSKELQRARFEDLARCLFCQRFNLRYGIFQYINHAGNETQTITEGNDIIGFQAKYFKRQINKTEILKSIVAAKTHNPTQTKIILYTNLTFGNPKKGQTQTQMQYEIEQEATKNHLSIEWATDNMILDQVAQCDWIYDVFFSADDTLATLIDKEQRNVRALLTSISSHILFQNQQIKIERTEILNQIYNDLGKHHHYIIHGDGGCGKTAIIKDFSEKYQQIPLCIRRAQNLNVTSVDEIISKNEKFSLPQFLNAYKDERDKVFVIDSAEHLQEIEDKSYALSFFNSLSDSGWTLVFTVRNVFLQDLCELLRDINLQTFSCLPIEEITESSLEEYAQKCQVSLPCDKVYRQRLCNPFYLALYLQCYDGCNPSKSYQAFLNQIWKEKISGTNTLKGINHNREKCFDQIIKNRIIGDCYYLTKDDLDGEALQALIKDEIIGECDEGIFITHDIYEEWGVLRMIEKIWNRKKDVNDFFSRIGSSYLVRKLFRQWLSNQIEHSSPKVQELISSSKVVCFEAPWQDEIIVSILTSTSCTDFLDQSKELLFAEDFALYKRILYLLHVACKRYEKTIKNEDAESHFYIPWGRGWEAVIAFTYSHKDKLLHIPFVKTICKDWCLSQCKGETTRQAGLIMLELLEEVENDTNKWLQGTRYIDELCMIICNAALEIQTELKELFEKICNNNWTHHNDPYYDFATYVLTQTSHNIFIIYSVPESVIALAWSYWLLDKENKDNSWIDNYDTNCHWGLRHEEGRKGYGPAGAMQTPIYNLLKYAPKLALPFVIQFVNHCVTYYANHPYEYDSDGVQKVKIHLQKGKVIEQWGAVVLWEIYRGSTHLVTPDLLQSIHMALEKYLLELAEKNYSRIPTIFDYILNNSQSVSLTAIVSSVVQAYPERYWKYALILFQTLELFQYDLHRHISEFHHSIINGISAMLDKKIIQERNETDKLPFRQTSLEKICVQYQYIRTSQLSEKDSATCVEQIHAIIDNHWTYLNSLSGDIKDNVEIQLCRMDRRKHHNAISMQGDQICIEMNPEIPTDVKQRSEEIVNNSKNSMRFFYLCVWSHKRLRHEDMSGYQQYDENINSVVDGIKELLNALSQHEALMPMDEWSPYSAAGMLVRDYYESLNQDDLNFCVELINNRLQDAFTDEYQPNIDDGLECCVHAIPQLIIHQYKECKQYQKSICHLLLNRMPIGQYKRVCDYALEAIRESNLWHTDEPFMKEVLREYILGAEYIDTIIHNEQRTSYYPYQFGVCTYSTKKVLQSVDQSIARHKGDVEISKIQEIERAEILLELLPLCHDDKEIANYSIQIIPFIQDTFRNSFNMGAHSNRYYRYFELYKAYAEYVLNQPITQIKDYIEPLLSYIKDSQRGADFLREFVFAEDKVKQTEAFWEVWKTLFSTLVSASDDILTPYLLVDRWFNSGVKEWHSLRECDTWLYRNMAEQNGDRPIVLYAIVKALNSIAQKYMNDGFYWLSKIIEQNPNLKLEHLQADTIYYLERYMEAYIKQHETNIRSNADIKRHCLQILTFMVNRESTIGYILRDKIG